MRHRSLVLSQGFGPASDESDQDGIAVPKGLKFVPKNPETPAEEMARLIRVIGGRAAAGEKDEQLRARAARRMGISASRAKTLWYAETDNIKSEEMDLARELAFVQPIEEAINAVAAVQEYLNGHLERLLDQATGVRGSHGAHPVRAGDRASLRSPSRLQMAGKARLSRGGGAAALAGLISPHGRLSAD